MRVTDRDTDGLTDRQTELRPQDRASQNVTRHMHYKIYNIKILDADGVEHHNVQY